MPRSLIPFFFGDYPFPEEEMTPFTGKGTDLTISEDAERVYVEAPIPGVAPENVEVTFHEGVLTVKGGREETQEDKTRKYYRKASTTFSYRVRVPGEIEEDQEPQATCERGVLHVSFVKRKATQPKRIEVKGQK